MTINARPESSAEVTKRIVRHVMGPGYDLEHGYETPPQAANDNRHLVAKKPTRIPTLQFVSPADWQDEPVPVRKWFLDGLVPMRQVTILAGDGGVGKSLLALQWGAASAMSCDALGMTPRAGRVIYLGAEDEEDEFKRRLADISAGLGGGFGDLGDFQLLPMADSDAMLAAPNRAGVMEPTPLFQSFEKSARAFDPTLIVLDTAADLFGGDEIKRAQVRQFIAMLRKLAIENNCAVLLLAHPSVEGMKSGTGSSGSTGWNNSVRSRLYLTKPDNKDEDPDSRILKTVKSNYGAGGDSTRLRWHEGAFVLDDGSVSNPAAGLLKKRDDELFIMLLSKLNSQGLPVSAVSGTNFAPAKMAKLDEANGTNKSRLAKSMQRLLDAGDIKIIEEGPPSRKRKRLIVTVEDFGNE